MKIEVSKRTAAGGRSKPHPLHVTMHAANLLLSVTGARPILVITLIQAGYIMHGIHMR